MNAFRHMLLLAFTAFFLSGCGTDDSLSGSATATTATTTTVAPAASIVLTADATQINSGTGDVVTLTAIVKDANNLLLNDAIVVFSSPLADNADIVQSSTTTDSSGLISATVGSLDPTNRTITVTATADSVSTSQTITVAGTAVTISGTQNLAYNQQTNLTISLTDSTGAGISAQTVTLATGDPLNTLSSSTVTTDSTGQASVTLTADGGNDTITASALGASTSFAITVSSDAFTVSMPSEINIDTCTAVTATWTSSGSGVSGRPVTFLTSRGAFYSDAGTCLTPASTATTDASGIATLYIQSSNPAPFTVTADASATGGPSATASSEFIATVPAVMTLQADDTTIGINDTATLTATVSDNKGNLVKNATVLFNITDDSTGGGISPTSDVTDSEGRAQSVYSSTSTVSSTDGITIQATVSGYPSIIKTINLTVSGTATSIIAGLANQVSPETPASYAHPGTVLVVDSGGNPVEGAQVDIKLVPTYYDKGHRTLGTEDYWFATSSITGGNTSLNLSCQSEDTLTGLQQYDLNGTLDSEDTDGDGIIDITEDRNGNGFLDPSGVATVETDLITNESGYAVFNVRYPKDNADWAQVRLIITARTATSESTKILNFVLEPLASDIQGTTGIVGVVSPWGDGGIWTPAVPNVSLESLNTPTDCINDP